jgi:flagellar L-ring protein precursor FlgH
MNRWSVLGMLGVLLLSGCSTHPMNAETNIKPPKWVEEVPSKDEEKMLGSMGSIMNQKIKDTRVKKVNDILSVYISVSLKASSSGKKSLSKTDNMELGGGLATYPNKAGGATADIMQIGANTFNRFANIGINAGGKSSFSGSGSNTRDETFSTVVSARVIKVLDNDTYFIEGNREVLLDGEKTFVQVSGVVRADDIAVNNGINSEKLADAKIVLSTEGDIEQSSSRGWLAKTVNAVWPF